MGKFKLAFGIHNHQPVGNFPNVFEEAHQQAYSAFLTLLSSYENIRISLHQSGILWNWQKENHPEYFELVQSMIGRRQIELLTGGFYEPILISIPERDALGQIEMMNRFLLDQFDSRTEGLWLTERIWEPHLPKLLESSGVKYLPIDDTHFIYTGLEHEQLTGPFVTEHEGHKVTLLPIQKKLRYLIPFGTVDKLIAELRTQAEKHPDGMAVYADDGEKFGVWPKTHEHCYSDGWLRQFFEAIEHNSDWLEVVPLSVAAKSEPVGRVYIPTASYEEMLHWALPPSAFVAYETFEHWLEESEKKEQYGRFVRGSHWRGFLAKYDESNLMHKKMLRISRELADYEDRHPEKCHELEAVRDRLYASQCNCPYWHGVFGGLYLPHIRQAVYSCMIKAHDELRVISGKKNQFSIETTDYDCDGIDEIVCDSDPFSVVFKPDKGGMLLDLSLNRHHFSLTDTLSRRNEGYHLKLAQAATAEQNGSHASIHDLVLAKEDGLERLLVDDKYLKRCFIDHFLDPHVDSEAFQSASFDERGDFVQGQYEAASDIARRVVVLTRTGVIETKTGGVPVTLSKEFLFEPERERLQVRYRISTPHPGGADVNFAIENNFNFQAGHTDDRFILVDGERKPESFLDSTGSHEAAGSVALVDQYRSIAVAMTSDSPAYLWHVPIFTVSLSEGGFEKVFQGTTIVHRYQLHLTDHPQVLNLALYAGDFQTVLRSISSTFAIDAR